MPTPKTTLTYFDFSGSRGEECRLALHLAGVDFKDNRLKREGWLAYKPDSPLGALPVLEIEGRGAVAQSNAILVLVGREHGLHPTDLFEAARHEALMGAVEDVRGRLQPVLRIKEPAEERQRAREEFATGYLQEWGTYIERQIAGPFVAGEKISVVDLKIYVATDGVFKGTFDHIPATALAPFPKLVALHTAVKSHPKVLDWQSRAH